MSGTNGFWIEHLHATQAKRAVIATVGGGLIIKALMDRCVKGLLFCKNEKHMEHLMAYAKKHIIIEAKTNPQSRFHVSRESVIKKLRLKPDMAHSSSDSDGDDAPRPLVTVVAEDQPIAAATASATAATRAAATQASSFAVVATAAFERPCDSDTPGQNALTGSFADAPSLDVGEYVVDYEGVDPLGQLFQEGNVDDDAQEPPASESKKVPKRKARAKKAAAVVTEDALEEPPKKRQKAGKGRGKGKAQAAAEAV